MRVKKIISGGQTGADQAGLRAARKLGLATGGWVPKGCLTQDGPRLWLLTKYGCQEHSSKYYPPRTFANVRDSDATLRFAINFQSPGELCTLRALNLYHKPYLDINPLTPPSLTQIRHWLKTHKVEILNVSGNSKKTCSWIGDFVFSYLVRLLKLHRRNHGHKK